MLRLSASQVTDCRLMVTLKSTFMVLKKKFGTVYLVKRHYFRSDKFFQLKIESYNRIRSYAFTLVYYTLTANFA